MRESVLTHGGLIISYIINSIIIIINTITLITNVYIGLSRVRKFNNTAFVVNKDDVIGPNDEFMKDIVYKEVFPQSIT